MPFWLTWILGKEIHPITAETVNIVGVAVVGDEAKCEFTILFSFKL